MIKYSPEEIAEIERIRREHPDLDPADKARILSDFQKKSRPRPAGERGPVLAIDPGSVSGAYCAIHRGNDVEVGDLPVVDGQLDAAALARLVRRLAPRVAVVERVGAMPKQGVASTFRFGYACGIVQGVLASCDVPIHFVAPTVWKRHYNLAGGDKEAARARAIEAHPGIVGLQLKKHHGRAEALLMAEWYLHQTRMKRP